MIRRLTIAVLFAAMGTAHATTPAYRVTSVKVGGEKLAEIFFGTTTAPDSVPKFAVTENTIEVMFPNAALDTAKGKISLDAPHALVSRVEATNENGAVRARVFVNGSVQGLRQRVGIARESGGVRIRLQFPAVADSTLDLMKEEQLPIAADVKTPKRAAGGMGVGSVLALVAVFLCLGGAVLFGLKFLKGHAIRGGSRKFLIEQLGYTAVGPGGKTGVGLLKIGREFVLVGVTSNQVSLLSTLPKLAEDYAEDAKYERSAFKDAVEEEYQRLKLTPEGASA